MDTDAVDTLAETLATGHLRLAVIGQGYVGLSLAAAAAAEGLVVSGIDSTRPGRLPVRRRQRGPRCRRRRLRHGRRERSAAFSSDFDAVADSRRRRASACRPRSSTTAPTCVVEGAGRAVARPAPGSAGHPRVDDLPGHHRAGRPPAAGGARACRPAATSCSPTRRSGSTPATRSTGCGTPRASSAASTPDATERRGRVLPAAGRRRHRAVQRPGRRAGQAAREHLPHGQHRPRQRAGAAVRRPGHRRLGGHRRGRDQAVRVHAVLPRPRRRRALHPARPDLPGLAVPPRHRPARSGWSSWRRTSTPRCPTTSAAASWTR